MIFFWGGLDHHIPDEQRQAVGKGVREALTPARYFPTRWRTSFSFSWHT